MFDLSSRSLFFSFLIKETLKFVFRSTLFKSQCVKKWSLHFVGYLEKTHGRAISSIMEKIPWWRDETVRWIEYWRFNRRTCALFNQSKGLIERLILLSRFVLTKIFLSLQDDQRKREFRFDFRWVILSLKRRILQTIVNKNFFFSIDFLREKIWNMSVLWTRCLS